MTKIMRKQSTRLTIVISLIFILSSLLPLMQIFLMYGNGGLLAIVDEILFRNDLDNTKVTNWIVNFSLSLLSLTLYFKTKTKSLKIIYSILFTVFSSLFICFLAYDYFGTEDPNPYYLYFVISSLISGIILNLVSLLKDKNEIERVSH